MYIFPNIYIFSRIVRKTWEYLCIWFVSYRKIGKKSGQSILISCKRYTEPIFLKTSMMSSFCYKHVSIILSCQTIVQSAMQWIKMLARLNVRLLCNNFSHKITKNTCLPDFTLDLLTNKGKKSSNIHQKIPTNHLYFYALVILSYNLSTHRNI